MAGQPSIQMAVIDGDIGAVRLLLERGTDVNATDGDRDTALHCAAMTGHEELVSFLLSSGADINRNGSDGMTALMYGAINGHEDVVRLLLRYLRGRGLDERDEGGGTALWLACWSQDENVGIVRVLLMTGADHTIPDNEGRTPHQLAQSKHHPQCTAVIQWWEGELQRAYVLHKARTIHDAAATRQQAPAALVPAYLSPRVQGGSVMPSVEVGGRGGSGGSSTKGAAKRGAEEEGGQETEEEELCAMVGYVVKDLAAELYIELLTGFHQ